MNGDYLCDYLWLQVLGHRDDSVKTDAKDISLVIRKSLSVLRKVKGK